MSFVDLAPLNQFDDSVLDASFCRPLDFAVWLLVNEGLHFPPFNKHDPKQGGLLHLGLDNETWKSWFVDIIKRLVVDRPMINQFDFSFFIKNEDLYSRLLGIRSIYPLRFMTPNTFYGTTLQQGVSYTISDLDLSTENLLYMYKLAGKTVRIHTVNYVDNVCYRYEDACIVGVKPGTKEQQNVDLKRVLIQTLIKERYNTLATQ